MLPQFNRWFEFHRMLSCSFKYQTYDPEICLNFWLYFKLTCQFRGLSFLFYWRRVSGKASQLILGVGLSLFFLSICLFEFNIFKGQFYRVQVGVQSPEGNTTTRGILRRFNDFLKLFGVVSLFIFLAVWYIQTSFSMSFWNLNHIAQTWLFFECFMGEEKKKERGLTSSHFNTC